MDWLRSELCIVIWVLCVTKSASQSLKNSDPDCVSGQFIPKPDDCNNCICYEEKIHCTNIPCQNKTQIDPECVDGQDVYRPDECNECYCFNGKLECSNLVCIRGSKCVVGRDIPPPDSCNHCKCIGGHITCTDYQCPEVISRNSFRPEISSLEVQLIKQCQEGDYIPPPLPPNDCNKCLCVNNEVLCTMETCSGIEPEVKGRLKHENVLNNVDVFDKQISVEPFVNMLYKSYDKTPTKLIHTHAYNGFQQEIKVKSKHFPKDTTKLFKVLAGTLDNPALVIIGENIKSSPAPLSNNREPNTSSIPQADQTNLSTEHLTEDHVLPKHLSDLSEIHLSQSSKLITSGSQSNETILVIKSSESFGNQNTQSVLPTASQHETYRNTVSSPAPILYKNIHKVNPYSSQEGKTEYPLEIISSEEQFKINRNPSKFGRPSHILTRNTVDIPNETTDGVLPNKNNKISQNEHQYKPILFNTVSQRDEFQPFNYNQVTGPINEILNFTSPHPILKPDQKHDIITSEDKCSQYNPHQSQFVSNPLKLDIHNSAHHPNIPKVTPYIPPHTQNQPISGFIDVRGSADRVHHTHDSTKDPIIPKADIYRLPQYKLNPPYNQPTPGIIDNSESADEFHYTHHSVKDFKSTKYNKFRPPQYLKKSQDQPTTEAFEGPKMADRFQNGHNPADDPNISNLFKPRHSQFTHAQNTHIIGVFGDPGTADTLQNAHNPNFPKFTPFMPPHTQNPPTPGAIDDLGSANGFHHTHNSAEGPKIPITDIQRQTQYQFYASYNQSISGDDHRAIDGFHYTNNSVENLKSTHDNKLRYPQYHSKISQHQPNTGQNQSKLVFDDPKITDRFQNVNKSTNDSNILKVTPYLPTHIQNQPSPGFIDDRGSTDGSHLISYPAENPNLANVNQYQTPKSQLNHSQDHSKSEVFDDRGSSDEFQYEYNSTEDTTNSTNYKTPQSQYNKPEDQLKTINDHELPDGIHHASTIEESSMFKTTHFKITQSRLKPKQNQSEHNPVPLLKDNFYNNHDKSENDQYKPPSIDSIFNEIHNVSRLLLAEDKKDLNSDKDNSTPWPRFKPDHDQYKPLSVDNMFNGIHHIPWNEDNKNGFIGSDDDPSVLNTDQDQNDPSSLDKPSCLKSNKFKPDQEISTQANGLIDSDQYNPLHSRFKANRDQDSFLLGDVKNLNYSDQLCPLPLGVENISESPSTDDSADEPYNVTVTSKQSSGKQEIGFTEIFHLLSKLISPQIQPIPERNNPENRDNIFQDHMEELIQTITPEPYIESRSNNQIQSHYMKVPKVPGDNRYGQPQVQYPDIHIILHQWNVEDDVAMPQYEADTASQVAEINPEELAPSFLLPKMLHPRFRFRPKEQKEECGEGTEWISNCHGCSCHGGQAICFKIPECDLRPFGEPMICKPYSHFEMGECYSCECSGDGVAECDASDCKTNDEEQDKGPHKLDLPVFHEFFDDKKTSELIQYYNFFKKLPKDCPIQTAYPTCEAGTSWISSCHKCECNEKSKHECTFIEGCELDFELYGKPGQCKPNSIFYPKTTNMPCVECRCDDEGNPYCPSADIKKY